jgi:hypothetical protein
VSRREARRGTPRTPGPTWPGVLGEAEGEIEQLELSRQAGGADVVADRGVGDRAHGSAPVAIIGAIAARTASISATPSPCDGAPSAPRGP